MRSPVTFVCLSVSKITQKRVHGFGWNFSCRQAGVGTWTNWSTFENLNVEHLLKSVKQALHSEQATGHRMHCREILFTPRRSPRASPEFSGPVDLFVWRTVAELWGIKFSQFLDSGLFRRFVRSTECPSSLLTYIVHTAASGGADKSRPKGDCVHKRSNGE